jgi:hypothetical protein
MKLCILCALFVMLPGCGTFKPQALPDGSYRLVCSSTLAQCVHRARKYCGDEELHVIQKSDDVVYGVEGHQTGAEGAEVHFRCSKPEAEQKWQLPPRREPPAAKESAEPAPQRVCIPGETQRCVGAGACEGGQACLPDGSGFGPCDCGPSARDAGLAEGGAGGAAPDDAASTEQTDQDAGDPTEE